MTAERGGSASALCRKPIGSVDPYALKIPARRAECRFTRTPPSRHSVPPSIGGVALSGPPKWPPPPPPLTRYVYFRAARDASTVIGVLLALHIVEGQDERKTLAIKRAVRRTEDARTISSSGNSTRNSHNNQCCACGGRSSSRHVPKHERRTRQGQRKALHGFSPP